MAKIETIAEKRFRDDGVEREVLAYILRKKPMMINKVEADWFASDIHRKLIRLQHEFKTQWAKSTLLSHLAKERMIPKGEREIFQDVIDSIFGIRITNMSDKAARISIENLKELYEGRTITYGLKDMLERFGKLTVTDMKNTMKELGSGVKSPGEIDSGDYITSHQERVKAVQEKKKLADQGKLVGIGTGIRVFDTMVGGLMPAEFGVIAGQPGVGKSATLGAFGKNAYMNGYNVLIVTGEMPKQDFEFRLDSDIANVPAMKFRWGSLTRTEMQRWHRAMDRLRDTQDNFLEIVSFPKNFTAADIEGHVLQLQDQYEKEIHLVCLDYINIMDSIHGKHSKSWEKQADAVWEVKAMCADLNNGISLWTAGQLTDEGIDAEVLDLSMLKYARAISETAPIVVGLVRTQDDEEENVLEMQVLKMRNAPLPDRSIILRPNLEYMRIHEEVVSTKKDLLTEGEGETRHKPVRRKKKR